MMKQTLLPARLKKGDCIGLAAPSWLATKERFMPIASALEEMGFRVKFAGNLFASGWEYAASPEERAADFNELIRDPDVRMVLFGGGEGADDIVPLIDYAAAKVDPKLYLSYSDGTSILNSLWSQAGISTLYGQMPGLMTNLSPYDRANFEAHVLHHSVRHERASDWHVLREGSAEGILIGGYLLNFIYLVTTGRIPLTPQSRYVLFIEDHEQFNNIQCESAWIGRLEQCGIMPHVSGLLFGHYAKERNPLLLKRLERLAEKWSIPAAYCDDFGHGEHHAILPVGVHATLDTAQCTLTYGEQGQLASAEARALDAIRREMDTIPGHTGFYYKNLVTGVEYGVREGETFGAASVIKLPLFVHILKESATGRMSMDECLTVTEQDKVPICGALTLFTGDVACDVRTLCRLMISISDNTATNRLIDYATIDGAAKGFAAMGLEKTKLTRKLFDSAASRAGLRNVICPKEIGALLEMLWRGEQTGDALCKEAIDTMHLQQVDHKLNGRICGEVRIAHKTGEDDELSNDVGIVYAKQPFVICFAGHDTDVYAWEDLMRRGTYALLRAQDTIEA